MKRISFILVLFLLCSGMLVMNSCTKDEEVQETKGIEYRELSGSEKVLKNQLAEAAKIVSEIASDQEVLTEVISAIKSQPKVLEDRVKFKELITGENFLKSGKLEYSTGKFATAFKNMLKKGSLKSGNTLIENLIEAGIEIYIPYPIEDYPEGTDIVVTSNPLDNTFENEGMFIGNPNKTVLANDELAKLYPIIIINTPYQSDEELKSLSIRRELMDNKILELKNSFLKSTEGDPTLNWNDESKHYAVYMPKIYCSNDHVTGLFTAPGYVYSTSGTVEFDSSTKIVMKNIETGTNGFSLPRKYEGYCENGYSKGWFDCNILLWQDWQPAITKNSLTIFMDTPNQSATCSTTINANWLEKAITLVGGVPANELSRSLGVSATTSTTITTRDFLYGSVPLLRDWYINNYPISKGVVWGEAGETFFNVEGVGNRPALSFSTELKYLTYCVTW